MSRPCSAGITLPIVLWATVVLAALATAALVAARLDATLARSELDHAAALAAAEAGVAEALSALATAPLVAAGSDSVFGAIGGARFHAHWVTVDGGVRIESVGRHGSGVRSVEAWVSSNAGGGLRISAWRDVR